jgi:hypothetical protein
MPSMAILCDAMAIDCHSSMVVAAYIASYVWFDDVEPLLPHGIGADTSQTDGWADGNRKHIITSLEIARDTLILSYCHTHEIGEQVVP